MVHQSSHISEVTEQQNDGVPLICQACPERAPQASMGAPCLKGLSSTVGRLGDWQITGGCIQDAQPFTVKFHPREMVKNLLGGAASFVVSDIASGHSEILITDTLGQVLLAGQTFPSPE